ncbi:hypothetical protein POTOM_013641 [Populus tomentosa]|uniref:Endonuclease/exonuclease/phosphatase domain-containing protein n=1 Tax=Populus tomentosa TaxID=118781 RepID=A0A8X8A6C8_POPTO|nr:hypothetical protein POTOM_013641 [Populus tomentosa]
MEGWNKNCIDILLQSWGNIVGYDTTCVSQGSISGIRVLINTRKLEPLHDQVILELDGTQVDVSLQEIKGDLIPSLTTVKHSMDVSLYMESVLSDDETGEVEVEIIPAASIPRATRQNAEFEFLHAWDNQNQVDSASLTPAISSEYLYPEITEVCRHAALSDDCMYDDNNRLALVSYDYIGVATADCIETAVQQTRCFFKKDGLDPPTSCSSGDLTMTGQDEIQKPSNMGQISTVIPSSGPSFANFISSIADPIELCDLKLQNRRSQRSKAKKLSRKSSSFKRRKSHKMANRSSKQAEMGITEYSVSDNGIMNRNAIIRSGRDLAREDDTSSVDEATSCWVVGKAILQSHEDSHLMTQTLQGGRDKKSCARSLVRNFSLDILGILETKLENIDDCTINSIWGRHSRDWYAVPSLGLSGGILCIWNPVSFCVSNCSVAMNGRILNIEGVLSRYNLECMVSLVYAPNDGLLKKEVWDYLVSFKNSFNKPWCLVGDFNETLSPSNRKGSSKILSSMLSFKICIDSYGLLELPLNGKKFTWSRGNAASRIDRMFVSGDWLQHLPSSTLYGLPKTFSDHRPLHMLVDSTNWGPKPVQMMNCWWLNSDFVKMVQSYWNTASHTSSGKRSMAAAFKLLKDRRKK